LAVAKRIRGLPNDAPNVSQEARVPTSSPALRKDAEKARSPLPPALPQTLRQALQGNNKPSSTNLIEEPWLPPPPSASPAIPQNPKQTSQDKGTPAPTILIEKPWSPPPPPPSREALPTSPREQGGAPAIAVEPPVPCKLPYRRAADIDGEFMSITGPAGERVYAAKSEVKKESYNSSGLVKGDV